MKFVLKLAQSINGISLSSDPKSSDPRASIGYLLQQLTEDYDKKGEQEKTKVKTASHTGFWGHKYIVDQYSQIDLKTMKWISKEELGNILYPFLVKNNNNYINVQLCCS